MATVEPGKKRAGVTGWFSELDLLLRGELTRVSSLRSGGLDISAARLSVIIVGLAMIYGVCMGTFAVFRARGVDPTACDLRLMLSVKNVADIPKQGKDLIIVATVDNVLHFRMFGGDGKLVVDTAETRLTGQAPQIEDLRKQLVGLWPPHELTGSEKGRVITAFTSIVGYTRDQAADPMQVCEGSALVLPDAARHFSVSLRV